MSLDDWPLQHSCPLCAHTGQLDAAAAPRNLYSEQLARLSGLSEADLLSALGNRQCSHCGLIYKARWLPEALLRELFGSAVRDHPKGWDAGGERFSAGSFAAEVAQWSAALADGDAAAIARGRRALSGVLDSLHLAPAPLRAAARTALSADASAALQALLPELGQYFAEPAPFKRFSGFSAASLWQWWTAQLGPIQAYAELGCPLWGQLGRQPARHYFLERAEANYWTAACQQRGQSCRAALAHSGRAPCVDWSQRGQLGLDLIAAFQYLDHVQDPLAFVGDCLAAAPALALVLDEVEAGLAVQHYTGWTPSALAHLAARHGKQLSLDFAPIRGSGNLACLLH